MPKPQYIICADNLLIDPKSGLVTHVNVVESLTVIRGRDVKSTELRHAAYFMGAKEHESFIRWMVTAVWTRDDGDSPDDVFEHELLLHTPLRPEPRILFGEEIQFAAFLYRLDVPCTGRLVTQSGVFRFQSRIRKKGGASDWVTQEYVIPVELKDLASVTA
jgi:hypothetical protein